MSGDIQIPDPLPVPWIILLQDDLFEPYMFFILERFSRQHQDIVLTKDKISFRYERVVIAQYDSDDHALGQMELGNTFFYPWIAGCQMDFDDMIPVGIATIPTPRNVMKIPNSFPSVVMG